MAPKTVLDTDILSEIYKRHNPSVTAKALAYLLDYERLSYTSTTASEFLFGFYAKDAKMQINQAKSFLRANEELVPNSEDYWLMAEINGALKRMGRPIEYGDTLIAAYVVNRGLVLATGNRKHYQCVVEAGFSLRFENWKES